MHTALANSPEDSLLQIVAPRGGTMDDFRLIHDDYSTSGSFSARSMRPVLIAGLLIAAGAGIVFGVNSYSDHATAKISAPASGPDPSVPQAASVPAIGNSQSLAIAPAATDSPTTDPLGTLTKSEQSNSMPMASHGNNHSSEAMNPVKAKSSVAAKSSAAAARTPAPRTATPPVSANDAISTPQPDVTPVPIIIAPAAAPIKIEEPPVVPAPTPVSLPVEPLPVN